uniref:uncharacterized protein LOC122594110 n=1 Tax=Erigeron canadensis TaxID=72917 RepID=UPI001CB9506B|nr:uncharacterized protein LOC122594110 [Erigeron canadensis]XP_043622519.1 uncharacterized protein LOC122594110 [Erigeron canadensis]
MMINFYCFQWIIALGFVLLAASVSSKNHGNQANNLVDMINNNRTSKRLPQLNNSPGLGCMALQYIKECRANCSQNNTVNCKPPESDFTEIFAPDCGVELPTFGTISGIIVGCQQKHLDLLEAFSRVLINNNRTLSLINNKTHTEVGVGIIRAKRHKGPYFWCALFSSNERNTSFVLEDLGKGIEQKEGCYSGTGISCSSGERNSYFVFVTNCVWTLIFCFLVVGKTS